MINKFMTEDMEDIVAICGEQVALELMKVLPGIEIKVPRDWTPDNPLSRLKRETAEVIIRNLAGNKFYVPTRSGRSNKRALARQLSEHGMNTIDIALELEVSERYVRRLLSET